MTPCQDLDPFSSFNTGRVLFNAATSARDQTIQLRDSVNFPAVRRWTCSVARNLVEDLELDFVDLRFGVEHQRFIFF